MLKTLMLKYYLIELQHPGLFFTWNLNDHESKLSGIQLIKSIIKLIKNLIDVNSIDCSNPIDHESY